MEWRKSTTCHLQKDRNFPYLQLLLLSTIAIFPNESVHAEPIHEAIQMMVCVPKKWRFPCPACLGTQQGSCVGPLGWSPLSVVAVTTSTSHPCQQKRDRDGALQGADWVATEKPQAQASPASTSRCSAISPVIPAELTQGKLKLSVAEAHELSWYTSGLPAAQIGPTTRPSKMVCS